MKNTSPISVLPASDDVHYKEKLTYAFPLGEIQRLTLSKSVDAITVRSVIRNLASLAGYSLLDQARISTAIFEIARDILAHAGNGEIVVSWIANDLPQQQGLHFFCHDCGAYNPMLTTKFQTGGNDTNSKLNFLAMRKMVDEFAYTRDPEYGNCITVIKWVKR